MEFFEIRSSFRVRGDDLVKINVILNTSDKYDSLSHFVRCAILKQIKEEEKVSRRV